jgi:catechol 2,3-dioxygenase-like lactoylglutathione lyase family enzyme
LASIIGVRGEPRGETAHARRGLPARPLAAVLLHKPKPPREASRHLDPAENEPETDRKGGRTMLASTNIQPMLPVKDLEEAAEFYDEVLGLRRVHEEPGTAVTYRSGNTTLNVYKSEFAGTNQGTAAMWEVDDVDGTVEQLKAKGVGFERYDMPGLERDGDLYRADGFAVAWFKDPAGNILSVQSKMKA